MFVSACSDDESTVALQSTTTQYSLQKRSLDEVHGDFPSCLDQRRLLADNFTPGPHDVICARGMDARKHIGNRRYRALINANLTEYSQASTKIDKSIIVSKVVNQVRQNSGIGGFVKMWEGKWYEVGDHVAREKTGQCFRDALYTQYKSSNKQKQKRRLCEKPIEPQEAQEEQVFVADLIQTHIKQIVADSARPSTHDETETVDLMDDEEADSRLQEAFTNANLNLLERIKRRRTNPMEEIERKLLQTPDGPPPNMASVLLECVSLLEQNRT